MSNPRSNPNTRNNDRFISRKLYECEKEAARIKLNGGFDSLSDNNENYHNAISEALFGRSAQHWKDTPILKLRDSQLPPFSANSYYGLGYAKPTAKIDHERLITQNKFDAYPVSDNFYDNALCFGPDSYILSGCAQDIKVYHSTKGYHCTLSVSMVIDEDDRSNDISAVQFSSHTSCIYAADKSGFIFLIDIGNKETYQYELEEDYICKFEPISPYVFMAGSYKGGIYTLDSRQANLTQYGRLNRGAVCGLSYNGSHILASGHNGNCVQIWDIRKTQATVNEFTEHKGAIKAVAFSPHDKNKLVSGGGTQDRTIKIWDYADKKSISSTQTEGQITGLHWLNEKNIFSALGYLSNSVCWWVEKGKKALTLVTQEKANIPSSNRILFSAQSPTVPNEMVTVGTDNQIRFWKANPSAPKKAKESCVGKLSAHHLIR